MRLAFALAAFVAACSSTGPGTLAVGPQPALAMAVPAAALTTGPLEIHQINVQQGDCTLIIGPDGTTFLIDAGNVGKGAAEVVPYLQSLGSNPSDGFDFMLSTHGDSDLLGGLDEVADGAGWVVRRRWDGPWYAWRLGCPSMKSASHRGGGHG